MTEEEAREVQIVLPLYMIVLLLTRTDNLDISQTCQTRDCIQPAKKGLWSSEIS